MTTSDGERGGPLFPWRVSGQVATVRISRPPVNAQNRDFRHGCIAAFDELGGEEDVRAIVLTGNGRVFSAGADLADRPDPTDAKAYREHNRLMRDCFDAILSCPKPVIAAIDGPAIAAGFVLASVCDILLVGESAWISMPEVEVGLAGGVRHLMRHLGASDARLAMFTGRRFTGPELSEMRAVSACVPDDELVARAEQIAGEIAANAPLAVAAAKRSFQLCEELSVHSGYSFEQSQTASLSRSEDALEALRAFEEKRPPTFRGR